MYQRLLFFGLVFCLCATAAHAECADPHLQALAAALHPGRQYDRDLVECKRWPADPTLNIFVLPFPQSGTDPSMTVYDVEVLVAQSETSKIFARLFKSDGWVSDAVRIDRVLIDTAPYQLTETSRAFGVRVRYQGGSGPNPYGAEVLSLYIIRDKALVPVAEEIMVRENKGEWDMNCSGVFEEFNRTLVVLPNRTNGFADILVREVALKRTMKKQGARCRETRTPAVRKYIITFAKSSYSIPKALRGRSS